MSLFPDRVRNFFSTRHSFVLVGLLLIYALLGCVYAVTRESQVAAIQSYPELASLSAGVWDYSRLAEYYKSLADSKGAPYAFEVLKRMPTFPNVDMHLLGHIVGDELYKQQGIEGMKVCTPDFRNACSHTVVIGALLEHGVGALPDIAKACEGAPGGAGAYTMCYHGLGHGVLAFTDYELPDAIALCKKTGTEAHNNREYVECVGGTIMEMIGGVHDPALRLEKSKTYFKDDDPLYPCDASFMPDDVRGICYTYITPHLFEAAGADLNAPTPDVFGKAFQYCNAIPQDEKKNRTACFGGFGKEFVVLGAQRDVRIVDALPDDRLRQVSSWCSLAGNTDGEQACSDAVIASLYWGGENDVRGALRYCELMDQHGPSADACYATLQSAVRYYNKDTQAQKSYCDLLSDDRKQACVQFFNL